MPTCCHIVFCYFVVFAHFYWCVCAAARQHSERVAAGGDMHVKMSWGKTQEAAALYCVMQLFPDSLLEEVRWASS